MFSFASAGNTPPYGACIAICECTTFARKRNAGFFRQTPTRSLSLFHHTRSQWRGCSLQDLYYLQKSIYTTSRPRSHMRGATCVWYWGRKKFQSQEYSLMKMERFSHDFFLAVAWKSMDTRSPVFPAEKTRLRCSNLHAKQAVVLLPYRSVGGAFLYQNGT